MRKYIPYIAIAVLAILLLLAVQKCSYNQRNAEVNTAALTDTVKHFANRLGTQTASIKTLQLDKKQMQNLLLDKDKELAELSKEFVQLDYVVKYRTVTRIDTIQVNYRDTVPCIFERTGAIKKDWYSFAYQSNQNGFTIDSLKLPNEATVLTGLKRKWFLGKETLTTDVTNTNPHIHVTNITAAELAVPSPWYKKWYVWLAIGAAGGMIIK